MYEALMESSADQWRRWRYMTDAAKEQYRAEAERIILGAFMPAVERILADRLATARREVEEMRAERDDVREQITALRDDLYPALDRAEAGVDDLRARLAAVEALAEEATERAYFQIAVEKCLTVMRVGDGRAAVPGHWREAAEAVASVEVTALCAALANPSAAQGEGEVGK